ncbi:hypothetical protein OSTOST_14841 [Ostertagia ostertagi]
MELYGTPDIVRRYGRVSVQRTFRDRTRPYEVLSDVEFRKDYRFSRHVFFQICGLVDADLQRTGLEKSINMSVADQVSMSIHLLGRNVMQSDAARLAGCNQSTVSRVLKNFVRAINRRASEYISWPSERESIGINASFYSRYHLPGIVGIIDGTHCRIQRPTTMRKILCAGKDTTASILQHEGAWVCANWPGSAHDSHVFKTSALYQQLRAGEVQGVLIGDSAYSAETFSIKGRYSRCH